jgi:hypothetical protein
VTLNLDKSTWKRVAFGDVIESVTERVDDPLKAGVERYVGLEHLDPGVLTVQRWDSPDKVAAQKLRFYPGDVIFGRRRAYQKKVAMAEFGGICSAHALVLRAKPGLIDPSFLPVFLASDYFLDRAVAISVGSLSPTVNWRDLKVQQFDLPPLEEQKRLASLLWSVERHKRNSLVASLRKVEGLRLKGLVEESAGPRKTIADLGSVTMGRQRSPRHATGENMVPYLRVANVGDGVLRLDDVKQMNFTPEEQVRYNLRPGDILVSEGQSRELVGQSVLIEDIQQPMCFQNTLIRFRANADVIAPQYAQALFRALLYTGVFAETATQTTSIAHLGVQRFARLSVPVPTLEEQKRVLELINGVRDASRSITAELDALTGLTRGIMTSVFGGAA